VEGEAIAPGRVFAVYGEIQSLGQYYLVALLAAPHGGNAPARLVFSLDTNVDTQCRLWFALRRGQPLHYDLAQEGVPDNRDGGGYPAELPKSEASSLLYRVPISRETVALDGYGLPDGDTTGKATKRDWLHFVEMHGAGSFVAYGHFAANGGVLSFHHHDGEEHHRGGEGEHLDPNPGYLLVSPFETPDPAEGGVSSGAGRSGSKVL
jgi:hypothetical protein